MLPSRSADAFRAVVVTFTASLCMGVGGKRYCVARGNDLIDLTAVSTRVFFVEIVNLLRILIPAIAVPIQRSTIPPDHSQPPIMSDTESAVERRVKRTLRIRDIDEVDYPMPRGDHSSRFTSR